MSDLSIPDQGNWLRWLTDAIRQHKARGNPMPGDPAPAAKRKPELVHSAEPIDDGPVNPLIKMAFDAMQAGHIPAAVRCLRTLNNIRIDKIAAVRKPAQQLATSRLIKADQTKELNMDNAQLESQIDDLIKQIDAVLLNDSVSKRRTKLTTHRIYDDGIDDVSNPAAHADGGDEEEPEDDEEEEAVEKASVNEFLRVDDTSNRPGGLSSSSHGQGGHKFERLINDIKNERGVPGSQAAHIARSEFPDVFREYQDSKKPIFGKRAPDLVGAEMAKGCTREVAMQRVAQLHGYPAFAGTLAKAADAEADFIAAAAEMQERDPSLDACSALRKARLSNPALYKRLQRV
jgi:hypothetical protein